MPSLGGLAASWEWSCIAYSSALVWHWPTAIPTPVPCSWATIRIVSHFTALTGVAACRRFNIKPSTRRSATAPVPACRWLAGVGSRLRNTRSEARRWYFASIALHGPLKAQTMDGPAAGSPAGLIGSPEIAAGKRAAARAMREARLEPPRSALPHLPWGYVASRRCRRPSPCWWQPS